jgi:hypothetical protein
MLGGEIVATKTMKDTTPPAGFRICGWLYMNDDGAGPFFTERMPNRYLNEWPIFEREPEDGHKCERDGVAYGECHLCIALDTPSN